MWNHLSERISFAPSMRGENYVKFQSKEISLPILPSPTSEVPQNNSTPPPSWGIPLIEEFPATAQRSTSPLLTSLNNKEQILKLPFIYCVFIEILIYSRSPLYR